MVSLIIIKRFHFLAFGQQKLEKYWQEKRYESQQTACSTLEGQLLCLTKGENKKKIG